MSCDGILVFKYSTIYQKFLTIFQRAFILKTTVHRTRPFAIVASWARYMPADQNKHNWLCYEICWSSFLQYVLVFEIIYTEFSITLCYCRLGLHHGGVRRHVSLRVYMWSSLSVTHLCSPRIATSQPAAVHPTTTATGTKTTNTRHSRHENRCVSRSRCETYQRHHWRWW